MGWLVAIICIVIVITFWRIFLPLGIGLAILAGVIFIYLQDSEKKKTEERARVAYELSQKIAKARANATPVGKSWRVRYEKDPAGGELIARTAYILSNDTLCTLRVQQRLDGSKLTGLNCPGFKLSEHTNLEVKFSSADYSVRMDVQNFSGIYGETSSVYIPSNQPQYSGHITYDDFIAGLKNGKAVAVRLPRISDVWVTFSLEGSIDALNQLGKAKPEFQ